MRWKINGSLPKDKQYIIAAAPHTTQKAVAAAAAKGEMLLHQLKEADSSC